MMWNVQGKEFSLFYFTLHPMYAKYLETSSFVAV